MAALGRQRPGRQTLVFRRAQSTAIGQKRTVKRNLRQQAIEGHFVSNLSILERLENSLEAYAAGSLTRAAFVDFLRNRIRALEGVPLTDSLRRAILPSGRAGERTCP